MNYLDRMRHRIEGKESRLPAYLGDKRKVREIAQLMGIRVSEIYFDGKLEDLQWSELPNEFVLKPSFASTSIGVYLLQRQEDGTYLNILTNKLVELAAIEEHLKTVALRFLGDEDRGTYLVEELLRDIDGTTPPRDVRLYSFFGEIGMVLMEDHLNNSHAEAMYFDGDFEPFEDRESRYGIAKGAEKLERILPSVRPAEARELLITAQRVSLAIPCSFSRVDFYNTSKGVYLGEITFFPGTFYYKDRKIMHDIEADRLGRLWARAEERLEIAKTTG
ncbi:ATP-grasp fold amidoligase family protein [Glutamicibacter protophormiae]